MDGHVIHVAVRMIHVVAATVMVGGLVGMAVGWSVSADRGTALVRTATRYEVAFWVAFGAIVATGVGNLGVFGEGLPGVRTRWGTTFSLKLVLVFALALVSALRMLIVVWLRDLDRAEVPPLLGTLYGSTATLGVVIVCAAVWLAHG